MIRIGQNLLTPVMNGCHDLLAQRFNRDRLDQQCWRRPYQGDPMFTNHPSNEDGIAVIRLYKQTTPMIEIPEVPATMTRVPQDFPGKVGTFQMLRPRTIEAVDTLMYSL